MLLRDFDNTLKSLIFTFIIVLTIGYFTGLLFVNETTHMQAEGIVENYIGNEDDLDAEIMKFKKSKHEMINILHTHILSMSVIFFLLGLLTYCCKIPDALKRFLMIEPLVSVLITFGGIFLIWNGWLWLKYVVMVSGFLMSASFVSSAFLIIKEILAKPQIK